MESTQTRGSVGSRESEDSRAKLSFRCDVEREAIARGRPHELYPNVSHEILLELVLGFV